MNSTRPDLNLLVAFDAIARTGSVTQAAHALALSQPAVSHALNRFRDLTGDPLFVRNGNRLEPTPHAQAIIPAVRRILEDVEQVLAAPTFDPASSARRFRIGASDYAMVCILPPLIRAARSAAPGIHLDVQSMGETTLTLLGTGDLDLAFIGARPPGEPLRSSELFRERFVGIVCACHPLATRARQNTVTIDDYLAFPHVMVSFRDPRQSPIDRALADLGQTRSVAVTTPNFAGNLASIRGTDLIISLPSKLARATDGGDLIQFDLPLDVPEYPYSAVWHKRTDQDVSMIWLRALIDKVFERSGMAS